MNNPKVTLHDVRIEGEGADREAVLAAIEQAVAQASSGGTPTTDAVRAAVSTSLAKP